MRSSDNRYLDTDVVVEAAMIVCLRMRSILLKERRSRVGALASVGDLCFELSLEYERSILQNDDRARRPRAPSVRPARAYKKMAEN